MGNPNQPGFATPMYNAPAGGGNISTALNINKPTIVKNTAGSVVKAIVTVAGSAAGGIYDTSTGGASTGTQIAVLPNSVGAIDIEFPCLSGISVVPGSGQSVSISYE